MIKCCSNKVRRNNLRATPGMLMVLSPYDDYLYSEISESREKFSIEKMAATITLCQLLGAKKLKTKNIKILDKATEKDLIFDLEMNSINGKLKTKKKQIESLKHQLSLTTEFSGCEANINVAQEFLTKNKLDTDIVLARLLEMKNYEIQDYNRVKKLTEEITLTSSLQNTFDFTANIDFPIGYINGDYKSNIKEKLEVSIKLEITF